MSSWLVSKKADTLFFYSSLVVVCMGLFLIFMNTPWFQHFKTIPSGALYLRIADALIGTLGASAALILMFGMAVYFAAKDRSQLSTKIGWLVAFSVTTCFGSALYFFTVYRKHRLDSDSYPIATSAAAKIMGFRSSRKNRRFDRNSNIFRSS